MDGCRLGRPVELVDEFLVWLTTIERSPNTSTDTRWPAVRERLHRRIHHPGGKIQDVREYMDMLYAHNVAFSDDVSPRPGVAGGV
ncbi:MAG: hypothetical protein WBP81_05415 [Solirubrobacteraceae bacterium]